MTEPIFTFDTTVLPPCGNLQRSATGLERWKQSTQEYSAIADRVANVSENPIGRKLLGCIFGNSPFLGQSLLLDAEFACNLFEYGPDTTFDIIIEKLGQEVRGEKRTAKIMKALRKAKRRIALTTAVADLTKLWNLVEVTAALSEFAELALSLATAHVLQGAHVSGDLPLANATAPERASGLFILGVGKLGAKELNYSSDIDLIVFYDPEKIPLKTPKMLAKTFVKATRQIVRIMNERNADGYVFRTDLRLRPDPGTTSVAVSTPAAEAYYESVGQNWERAALIKARVVAGDQQTGETFLNALRPFIWRKHLDFAAIEDIHSIKRQITTHRGGGLIEVSRDNLMGHNIKVGRGGIREIEFFTQTQQLIWGGRIPELRGRETIETLNQLAKFEKISNETKTEMIAAYEYLRRLEHRLQMINDIQTHSLPKNYTALTAVAKFMGYHDVENMLDDLSHHLVCVERHYEQLFETASDLGGEGSLVFTGSDLDSDTVTTLEEMGFKDGTSISFVVRGWHHGRYRAMRSTRARELLTELMPRLLEALARTTNPDVALANFDKFLATLPTGVQLFSLFYANPALLDLVAEIMGSAPRLANRLSHQPILLDSVLSSEFFEPLINNGNLATDLDRMLVQATDHQDVLNFTRRWVSDHEFQTGVQVLRDRCSYEQSGQVMANLADVAIHALKCSVEDDFAKRYGRVPSGELAVIALGKLGSQELTAESDLDLVFVYRYNPDVEKSDGSIPLSPAAYFVRLSQRLIGAITSLTSEGRLYKVDTLLRPSGASGPIAISFDGFMKYFYEKAWTWEYMALTRARLIATPAALNARLTSAIYALLTLKRDTDRLVIEIADMRRRVAKEHPSPSQWDIKYRRGGLMDIEFIAQYLQLRYAPADATVLSVSTSSALKKLALAGHIELHVTNDLLTALSLWQHLQGILRLTLAENSDVEAAPHGLHPVLIRNTKAKSLSGLKDEMDNAAHHVITHFKQLIDEPAAAARDILDAENSYI